jgi:polyhydroxyalkanoate synthesis regulator phasin
MAQTDLLKRYLDAGVAFTQLTQQKAEEIVRDLVHAGEVNTADARKRVEELLDRSVQSTEGVVALVRAEVQAQVAKLGLVPKVDLDAVKRELAKLTAQLPKTVAKAAAPATKVVAKKAPAKKVAAKKTVAKKAVAKKAPATKTVAKKAAAKKTVAKKTVAKKTVAKKTVAKKAVAKKTAGATRA